MRKIPHEQESAETTKKGLASLELENIKQYSETLKRKNV